jgi:hypothetical protein
MIGHTPQYQSESGIQFRLSVVLIWRNMQDLRDRAGTGYFAWIKCGIGIKAIFCGGGNEARQISPAVGELHIQTAAVPSHHRMAAGSPEVRHMTGVPHTAAAVLVDNVAADLAGVAHIVAGVAHTAAGVVHTAAGVVRSLVVGMAGRSPAVVVRRFAVDCTCAVDPQCRYFAL